MNNLYQIFFIILLLFTWNHSGASESHKHQLEKTDESAQGHHEHEHEQNHQEADQKQPEDEDEHKDEHEHSDDDEHNDSHTKGKKNPHEHGHEKSQSKTILEIRGEGRKFKLSKKAIETLKLKYSSCQYANRGDLRIPKNSLIKYGNKFGIFLHESDWFELVEVKIAANSKVEYRVTPLNNIVNDACEVVISGVPLLRVAQLEASGEGGKGHAH